MAVIEMNDVVKTFGSVHALDGFDLRVEPGEVHGFLGPNGAGKSTALKLLLGMLRADSGVARLFGRDAWREAPQLHRRLAYVPGEVNLWPNLTGGEVIDLLGRMRGGLDEQRRVDLVERFELDESRYCGTYSKGNRQKVVLVAALASRVELHLLDEPTAGLDPLKEAEFQRVVHQLRDEGVTVLLSSHILAEVEALCDRVSIIREGRLVQSGSLADLRHHTRTTVVAALESGAVADLAALPGVHHPRSEGGQITLEVDTAQLSEVMAALAARGLVSLQAHPPTMEELFLREYGDVTG